MNPLGQIISTLVFVVFFAVCVAWIVDVFSGEDPDA